MNYEDIAILKFPNKKSSNSPMNYPQIPQRNEKNIEKYLHNSFIFSNFAAELKKKRKEMKNGRKI